MQLAQSIQTLAQKLQADPNGPDAPALRTQITTQQAVLLQKATAAGNQAKQSLRPMMTMNYVVAGFGGIFALGAIGYLILTRGGVIYIGAGIFIVIMLIYGGLGMIRAKRAFDFSMRDQTIPPNTR